MVTQEHALGRLEAFDDRSRAFQIRATLDAAGITTPRSYTWSIIPRLNQGNVGACVGFAFAHEVAARPVARPADAALAFRFYNRAQQTDPWANTPPQEGTSVLDGVKAAQEAGYYSEYRWAGAGSGRALEDLILAVGYKGPAVLGVPWYSSAFDPDADGLIRLSGGIAGGHAILCNGVNVRSRRFRLTNSWGAGWGLGGQCFVTFEDMDRLLHEGGEACIPSGRT